MYVNIAIICNVKLREYNDSIMRYMSHKNTTLWEMSLWNHLWQIPHWLLARWCYQWVGLTWVISPELVSVSYLPWNVISLNQAAHTMLYQVQNKQTNVLFNDALNTFYLRLYGVRHMVKDHSDSEKGNLLPPHRLLLSINSKGSFICTIPQTG